MRRVFLPLVAAACVMLASFAFAQVAPAPAPQTVVVSVDRANLRDKPSTTGSAIVVTLSKGDQLDVLETTGTWYRVRVKTTGRTGYISNTVVQAVAAAAPVASPARPAAPPAAAPSTPAASAPAPRPAQPSAPAPAPQAAAPRAATAKPKIGFRAYVIFDREMLAASKSFEAVLGTGKATTSSIGFNVEAVDLWKSVFARFAYTHSSSTGSRVFVDPALAVHSLGIPLTIEMTPIEIGGGWRFKDVTPKGRVGIVPYAGASELMLGYKETSTFATADENSDVSFKGQAIFGGVELSMRNVKFLKIGVEGQYRNVPDAIGADGVSQDFNETNLGGTVIRLKVGVGF